MAETAKLALRLFLFSVIAAVALAVTNEITKGPIKEQAAAKANAAREMVFETADSFEQLSEGGIEGYSEIDAVYSALEQGEMIGYVFELSPRGYKGDIEMTLGISVDGQVTRLTVMSQSETAGLGSKVAEEPFLSQFPGIEAQADALNASVDTITGATVSSRAVLTGVSQAMEYYQTNLKQGG